MPSNPTDAQIAATQPVELGDVRVAQGLDDNLFASGILKPEHSNFLSYQFPQYVATAMLERLGRYEPIAQPEWSWSEMERTRKSVEITAGVAGLPTSPLTLTTDEPATASGEGYFLVNDILLTETFINIRVTAIGEAGGFQTITVVKVDGTNFAAGEIANNERVGHSTSSFEEGSNAPNSRKYLPTEKRNKLNIMRRTCEITGSALNARTWLDNGKSWYFEQEMIDMDEFSRDRENAIMFNTQSTAATTADPQTGDGIVPLVEAGGVTNTFGGSVTETDIQNHMRDMMVQSPAKEFAVFCGADFLTASQQALRDYQTSGGVSFGSFGENTVGIDVHQYKFLGKIVSFIHYPTFDDLETLPFGATATGTKKNYSNYSLWLNLGTQRGHKLLTLKYSELDGRQRKFRYAYENGIMSLNEDRTVANGFDGFKSHMFSDMGIEVRLLNNHGTLFANS